MMENVTIPTVRCFLYVYNHNDQSDSYADERGGEPKLEATFDLVPDEVKKSVLWLRNETSSITCNRVELSAQADSTLYFGGFQMISTAQAVDVFVNHSETLLMTVRGIRNRSAGDDATWTKAQCVVPGGARPVKHVCLVLKSSNSDDAAEAFRIQTIRWTIRVPAFAAQSVERESNITEPASHVQDSSETSSNEQNTYGRLAQPLSDATEGAQPSQRSLPLLDDHSAQTLSMQLSLMTQQMAALTTAMNSLNDTIQGHREFLVEQENRRSNARRATDAGNES